MSDLFNGVRQKAIAFLLAEDDRLFDYIHILVTIVAKSNERI
ncbi:hypothetical protein [Nostoc sp. FACHB-145]|nr:hypothetical protein [Nostoc sp. FACHB-145]